MSGSVITQKDQYAAVEREKIVLYFELHHAPRLRTTLSDDANPFDDAATDAEISALCHEVYQPAIEMLLRVVERESGVGFGLAVSGSMVELLSKFAPGCLDALHRLFQNGSVDCLAVPYHYSVAAAVSEDLFRDDVIRHSELMHARFGIQPKILLAAPFFIDSMPRMASAMGMTGLLLKNGDLRHGSIRYSEPEIACLITNEEISGRLSRQFGAGDATLTTEVLGDLIQKAAYDPVIIGCPMQVFAEHSKAGILSFFECFMTGGENMLIRPSDCLQLRPTGSPVAPPLPTTDLSRWLGEDLQRTALTSSLPLLEMTNSTQDDGIKQEWLALLAEDYFRDLSSSARHLESPYLSPHETLVNYKQLVNNLIERAANAPAATGDDSSKEIENARQHPTTPPWAIAEQSRYKEVTQTHL